MFVLTTIPLNVIKPSYDEILTQQTSGYDKTVDSVRMIYDIVILH
jgi:hypothetical protein